MWYVIDSSAPIEVSRIGRIRYVSNWNLSGHKSGADRIIFVLKGQIRYTINTLTYTVGKGDYVFIPKGAEYSSFIEESCEFYYVHFSAQGITTISDEQCRERKAARLAAYEARPSESFGRFGSCVDYDIYLKDSAATGEHLSSILLMLNKCDAGCYLHTPESKQLLNLRVHRLLLKLAECVDKAASPDPIPPVLLKMTAYIEQNYTTDITLSSLSEQFSLSKQYIIRLFKKYLGTTVTKHINMMRLERSLELLRHSGLNVSEIAAFLGYHSVYYFCRIFKATYHITPTCYIRGEGDIDFD